MSSSSKRQAKTPPTIIDLDHVLIAIAQCIPVAKDVMAFLAALPASARSRPLTALYQLLQDPRRHVLATESEPLDALWPLLRLDVITPAATSLVRDAMPVIPSASAGTLSAARPSDLDALEWLELWSTKLTHYKHVEDDAVYDRSQLCSVLRQCHKLQVVDTSSAIDVPSSIAFFEAVTTPLHGARPLTITSSQPAAIFRNLLVSMPRSIRHGCGKIELIGSGMRDEDASALAAALRHTASPHGAILDFSDVRLSVQSYLALGDALTTCRRVSIELPRIRSEVFKSEAAKRHIRYRYGRTSRRLRCLVLQSPMDGA
ncbi:hypothetical protein SPRG_03116 [Saprolegnia parasitica CBS 223.65]|uniref:Uncharacterized protein n=1 Tax=Saprolegnia parasitica (strain CBS 223.65) TaxID=695850 RepID=A0A067CRM2_SAPPC|nr:hypothetical protein SPRG_03116 [Saprolegnia parasitica CBS 223.65]KDO31900.1 hypothetical protein SPRG_03116 [Saprolegnia parasitica CBS 223.65]|eukprot:XP_012197099.1 hypothetical protein SPRG_03116 [Saprolegnia parasitica CBS 223.65]